MPERDTTLLNFSHPLLPEQVGEIEKLLPGGRISEVRQVKTHFDNEAPFAGQVRELAEAAGLSPQEWQTLSILVNPPAHSPIALTLLSELHGRMGYFPAVIRLKPVNGATPPKFDVAEIINLQAVRDAARMKR